MRKLFYLTALIPFVLLSACSNGDEPTPENPKQDTPVYSVSDEDFISKISDIVWIISSAKDIRSFYGDGTETDRESWPEGIQMVHDLKFEGGKLVKYWRPYGNLIPKVYGVPLSYEFDASSGLIYIDGVKKYRIEGLEDGRLIMTDYNGLLYKPVYDAEGEITGGGNDPDSYIIYSLRPATEEETALYNGD